MLDFDLLKDCYGCGACVNVCPRGAVHMTQAADGSYIPEIDEARCIGCGRCYIACYDAGHQALGFDAEARKPVFLGSKCVGCHLCATVCPVNCISKAKRVAKKH